MRSSGWRAHFFRARSTPDAREEICGGSVWFAISRCSLAQVDDLQFDRAVVAPLVGVLQPCRQTAAIRGYACRFGKAGNYLLIALFIGTVEAGLLPNLRKMDELQGSAGTDFADIPQLDHTPRLIMAQTDLLETDDKAA